MTTSHFKIPPSAPFPALALQREHDTLRALDLLSDLPASPAWEPENTSLSRWLQAYFAASPLPVPVDLPQGTPFQRRVWQALLEIPWGETRTYGELARELATGPRAVGMACRSNPIPLLIPCHRVVGQKGLGGYQGAAERSLAMKAWLLALERGGDSSCKNLATGFSPSSS